MLWAIIMHATHHENNLIGQRAELLYPEMFAGTNMFVSHRQSLKLSDLYFQLKRTRLFLHC